MSEHATKYGHSYDRPCTQCGAMHSASPRREVRATRLHSWCQRCEASANLERKAKGIVKAIDAILAD